MSVYLVLLTEGASLDIVFYKCGKARPPIILLNKLLGFELSWMTGGECVMVAGNHLSPHL